MTFRCYPGSYTPPENQLPDFSIDTTDARVTRWGSCWKSYYVVETNYFTSEVSRSLLGILSKSFLWMRALSSTATLEKETRERFADRVDGTVSKLNDAGKGVGGGHGAKGRGAASSSTESMDIAVKSSSEISMEQLQTQIAQVCKCCLFNISRE